MQEILSWLQELLGIDHSVQTRLFSSVVTIFAFWLIRLLLLKLIRRRIKDIRLQYRWRKTTTYVTFIIAIFLVGRIWFEGIQSLSTFLGLLSAGVAIALQDLIVNFAGWIFIIWRRPFKVGDRVQIGEIRGDVIDLRIFMFLLMEVGNWVDADQSTGRILYIPNGRIYKDVLANYSEGFHFIWNEIPVLLTFESNWKKAKSILKEIILKHTEHRSKAAEKKVKQAARKYLIYYSNLTPIVYTSVRDSGVLLTIRFLTEPRKRRGTEETIWEDILDAFHQEPDIDFAYPTQRFYDNLTEGKPGTKSSPEQK